MGVDLETLRNRDTLAAMAGGQISPNMFAVRAFQPKHLVVFHTGYDDSRDAARRLEKLCGVAKVRFIELPSALDYEPIAACLRASLAVIEPARLHICATSGTKPMLLAALAVAERLGGIPVSYYERGFRFFSPRTPTVLPLPEEARPGSVREFVSWQEAGYRLQHAKSRMPGAGTLVEKLVTALEGFAEVRDPVLKVVIEDASRFQLASFDAAFLAGDGLVLATCVEDPRPDSDRLEREANALLAMKPLLGGLKTKLLVLTWKDWNSIRRGKLRRLLQYAELANLHLFTREDLGDLAAKLAERLDLAKREPAPSNATVEQVAV